VSGAEHSRRILGGGYGFASAGPAAAADAATIVIMDASVSAAFVIGLTATLLRVSPACGPSRPPDEMELARTGRIFSKGKISGGPLLPSLDS
jgi:hypothetical protein